MVVVIVLVLVVLFFLFGGMSMLDGGASTPAPSTPAPVPGGQ